MAAYTIAPSPWEDDPGGFIILRLGTTMVFWCSQGHSWPGTEKHFWYRIKKGPVWEKWTLSIWDGDMFGRFTTEERKDLAAAWRWYKKHRKEKETQMPLASFSLS